MINKNLQNTIKVRNYVNFFKADFTNFEYDNYTAKNYSIYSRFTLHAINYKEEEVFLQNIFNIRKLDYVLIEARTIRDNLYGNGTNVGLHEYVTSHYRRFIDPEILIKKLEKYFKIIYAEENIGFSIIKNDNPTLIRLICKRI